ncbi:MAG TPA: NADH-quinone oxidoreductase subunit L [Gemmataceae bacterium]|nr:NADH-quinone oxidoreductase subunit L [Gemmataceae bacterium]
MNLLELFGEHPGWYFVAATLVPLLSFVLILLAAAMWCATRPFRTTPAGAALFKLFGGEERGPIPAYVATGAIALAFVFSLIGFIKFTAQQSTFETQIAQSQKQLHALSLKAKAAEEKDKHELEEEIEAEEKKLETTEKMWASARNYAWNGHFDWLRIRPAGMSDPDRGTVLQLGFKIDSLSALMFVMVTFIATLIHLFSIGYMSDELQPEVEDHQVHTRYGHLVRRGRFGRFFMYLSLFCFSMLNLVLADNLFQVFLSWELVGICSYLLVGFYFERQTASNAANKAFITNRVGDAGFILGLLILWTNLGTFNFDEIFHRIRAPLSDSHGSVNVAGRFVRGNVDANNVTKDGQGFTQDEHGSQILLFPHKEPEHYHALVNRVSDNPKPDQHSSMPYWLVVAAGLGIFLGCVGKSAQFPLQVWLPDAMEGPTPVSALIHAATMVAAGVYLVGRCYPLFTYETLLVIAYTGGITLFVAATIAIVMTDIKKVLAYSTVSQLGYMMLALGVGGWVAGLFHLMTHAFFKALLFLCSGSVIYGCHHEQDMLKMGGLFPKMKITALTMLTGVLAIAGIPLFTGWYSKDAILAQAFGFIYVHPQHLLLFLLPLATAGITAFYMSRLWLLTFTGKPRDEHVYEHAHESPWTMTVPLIALAVCSVCVAWGWPVYDAEASWLEHNVHHAQHHAVLADFGSIDYTVSEDHGEYWVVAKRAEENERLYAHYNHHLAGNLALGLVAIGIAFAGVIYWKRLLDPAEAKEQFPRIHAFLMDKWRFDWLYSVMLVRPALVVGHWLAAFDLRVIDGIIHALARFGVLLSKWDGLFDNHIVDGLVNLVGNVMYDIGARLRNVQTGFLRSYVLFLVLAAAGIFMVLAYFVRMATAG